MLPSIAALLLFMSCVDVSVHSTTTRSSRPMDPGIVHSPEISSKSLKLNIHRCSAYQFRCLSDGTCIDMSKRCDSNPDCVDASDESTCISCDSRRFFMCHDQQECISNSFVCDDGYDCPDHSDELNCTREESSHCFPGNFRCKSDNFCLPESFKCDGHADCTDHSDEDDCKNKSSCTADQYSCPHSSLCIAMEFVCDGEPDCNNGEEERDCETTRCLHNLNHYECLDGTCLNPEVVCDNKTDCQDGSDEGGLCSRPCKEGECSYQCYNTPKGPHCVCPTGYNLVNNTACEDFDECNGKVSICEHFCENTPGSFRCSCAHGYTLFGDNSCYSDNHGSGFLLFANKAEIRKWSIQDKLFASVYAGTQLIKALTYDPMEETVFMSNGKEIFMKSLNSPWPPTTFISRGLVKIESLASDWYGKNLYIADSGMQSIVVCSTEDLHCTPIIDSPISPKNIQLDLENRLMFWTDSKNMSIEKASLDGSQRVKLLSTLGDPTALALDPPARRVYWMDRSSFEIQHMKYDGTDKKHLPHGSLRQPFSMAIWENRIYWSDKFYDRIASSLKINGKDDRVILQSGYHELGPVVLYHSSMIRGTNPCSSRMCSHICLLTPNSLGFRCACPNGMALDGEYGCIDNGPSSKIFVADGSKIYEVISPAFGQTLLVPRMQTTKFDLIGDLVYNPLSESLIISDVHAKMILEVPLGSGHVRHIIDNVRAIGIAFDWLRKNIYWVDGDKKLVEVVTAFGAYRAVLGDHYSLPTAIAVAPVQRYLFVGDSGGRPTIYRSGLDGTDKNMIIRSNLGRIVSLIVNTQNGKNELYLCDANEGRIEVTDFNGSSRKIILQNIRRPVSFLVVNDEIFWTTEELNGLHYLPKERTVTKSVSLDLEMAEYGVRALRLVEVKELKEDFNGTACQQGNGGCSHLCLGNEHEDGICSCALGFELADDGKKCNPLNCSRNLFMCPSTKACISEHWRCDGTRDCEDGGDEENCTPEARNCSTSEFRCGSGNCISKDKLCNRFEDCFDGSDEALPECAHMPCRKDFFACNTGGCIPKLWVCDTHNDCTDGSDEINCSVPDHKFQCKAGEHILRVWVCDGENDCPDGDDEANCTNIVNTTIKPECSEDEIACIGYEVQCIPKQKLCDGIKDCSLGEDEDKCDCDDGEVRCATNDKCIPSRFKCDGFPDCPDESDEISCSNSWTSTTTTTTTRTTTAFHDWDCDLGEFKCDNGQCISKRFVCDGKSDCTDGSDEYDRCFANCQNNNGGCQHECRTSIKGVHCSCYKGFHLSFDNTSCLDDKECDHEDTCGHYCTETDGSYYCSCREGYDIQLDRRNCKPKDGKEVALLVGRQTMVNVTDQLNQISKKPLANGVGDIAYDPIREIMVYINEFSSVCRTVEKNTISENDVEIRRRCNNPQGLSIDYRTGNFYYTEFFINPLILDIEEFQRTKRSDTREMDIFTVIQMCSLEKGSCAQIYRAYNIKIPSTRVSVDHAKLFYCTNHQSHENQAQIYVSNLDGQMPRVLRETRVVRCGSLALDEPKMRLYWTDTAVNSILSIKYTGEDYKAVVIEGIHHPIGLTVIGNSIMWYDGKMGKITRCNKLNPGGCKGKSFEHTNSSQEFEARALITIRPPRKFDDLCHQKNCSQLCKIVNSEAKCFCGVGYNISSEDPKTCIEVVVPNNPCGAGICEMLSSNRFVCRCPDDYSGQLCEVKLSVLPSSSIPGATAGIIVFVLLILIIALGVWWYKRHPFIIWKAKNQRANQSYRFSNPAFGVMSAVPIITNSPAPSSSPSLSNNPPPYSVTNTKPAFNSFENPLSKTECNADSQVNTSLDSAVASGTDTSSANNVTQTINLHSPIDMPDCLPVIGKKEWVLSPYNPTPPL